MATDNNIPINQSLKEYARGIVGGLMFSLPLLYTMEVWWAGFSTAPHLFIIYILVTFGLLLGYNKYAGMRESATWKEIAIDSVEEIGIGIVLSFLILWMLNRINFQDMMLDEIVGKTVIEAMAVAIGVSIGTAQLGMQEGDTGYEEGSSTEKTERIRKRPGYGSQIVLALCGSIIVGGNVAPTEEVLMLAIEAKPIHILLMAWVSLLISVVILFFSDFKGSFKSDTKNMAYIISMDTCLCYAVALIASAFILWFFGRFANVSFDVGLAQTVTLGLPATLGASAGRLLIK